MDSLFFELNEAKMFADITDGTAIVINSFTGVYYGMNKLGTSIFQNLLSGISVNAINEAIRVIPGAPEDFTDNLKAFIETISEYDIIIPSTMSSREKPVIDPEIANEDLFQPECIEYKDIQELLYADPIHDVEEDKGWTPQ